MKRKMYANFNELVFEDRNRYYGAYVLRKQYEDNLFMGLLFGVLLVGVIVAIPYIRDLFKEKPAEFREIGYEMPLPQVIPDEPEVQIMPPVAETQQVQPDAATKALTTFVISDHAAEIVTMEEMEKFMPGTENNDGIFSLNTPPITNINDKIIGNGNDGGPVDFVKIETKPEYPGGETEMYKYLGESIVYPDHAKNVGITGTVYLQFVIDEFGGIRDVTVARGIGGGCDEEAVRVIKNMKRWKPGRQGGHPVKVRYSIPIQFNLN